MSTVQYNRKTEEIARSVAVFSMATSASVTGQAVTDAFIIGVVVTTLPVAGDRLH